MTSRPDEEGGILRDRARERLVVVAVADNHFTAELLREQLREAGIPSTSRNREGGAAVLGGIGGTFEIAVLEGDSDRAASMLGGATQAPLVPSPSLPPGPRRRRRRWWR